jgi:hypothetical protein
MYVDGNNRRRISRHLKVAPQAVTLSDGCSRNLASRTPAQRVKDAEMDEMFTFIWHKKAKSILSRR